MHLYFERNANAKCDCNILSLSWMGKLPDELQEDESWKLYRRKYYQEGWLASGNARGLVGVTFTTSHCRSRAPELPQRANYNLRGHRSEVILVKWNEPYQKLASCDSTGVIFVWIKYDGRWSIELINDRSTPVTYFSWSHDGRMALICYKDGFVLVGSVAGQRYWSSMLNHKAVITCGIWTPDDQQVYFGTTAGQLIVMDVHGAMVSEVQLGSGVTSMAWSAEKFKLEEDINEEDNVNNEEDDDKEDDDRDDDYDTNHCSSNSNNNNHNHNNSNNNNNESKTYVLAICLANGNVVLLKSFDDVSPITISTGLRPPLHADWSNSRKLLAIAGTKDDDYSISSQTNGFFQYENLLKFYSDCGVLIYTINVPFSQSPVTAMTWGHNDRRIFVATGAYVHAAWVSRGVGSLQLLSRLALKAALMNELSVEQLPLPPRLKALVAGLFSNTIRSCIPEPRELRHFVSRPPPGGGRLHCTMLRNHGEPPHSYTLYVEYLGGLVPLLKGRRTSKIRPEFVIFDPEIGSADTCNNDSSNSSPTAAAVTVSLLSCSDDSDNDRDAIELCTGSPRFRRKNKRRFRAYEKANNDDDDASYFDTLPEKAKLVEVTSNIWGTKFKFHGLADSVPANLGRVTYRTSLLHLQPRQMTLVITELRDDIPAGPDPSFNPNLFSEDEEDLNLVESHPVKMQLRCSAEVQIPAVAPITARSSRFSPNNRSKLSQTSSDPDNFEEEYPYKDAHEVVSYCEPVRASRAGYASNGRHSAPRCCDVPALQSPKNAVAPTQTLIATSSPTTTLSDYTSNLQRVKSALADQQNVASIKKELENNKLISFMHTVPSTVLTSDENSHSTNMLIKNAGNCQSSKSSSSIQQSNYLYANLESSKNSLNALGNNNVNNSLLSSSVVNVNSSNKSGTSLVAERDVQNQQIQFGHRRTPTVVTIGPTQFSTNSIVRSCSVGYLDFVDAQIVPCDVALNMLRKDAPNKRLFLYSKKPKRKKREKDKDEVVHRSSKPRLNNCGKSRSLDSSELFPSMEYISFSPKLAEHVEETAIAINNQAEYCNAKIEAEPESKLNIEKPPNPSKSSCLSPIKGSSVSSSLASSLEGLSSRLDRLAMRLREYDDPSQSPRPSSRLPRSSPSSPAPLKKGKRPSSASPIRRRLLSSPLLNRKAKKNRNESSDEEGLMNKDDLSSYHDLETFQKAQLRQKLRQRGYGYKSEIAKQEITMHNKAPMWNEANQVYQLDFGGRVTQESAKNFQIEFRDNQVMQFGRIQGNAYTLDFQYPFSAIQAFAVALASVTQRLK